MAYPTPASLLKAAENFCLGYRRNQPTRQLVCLFTCLLIIVSAFLFATDAHAQKCTSLQVLVDGDPLPPPVIKLGSGSSFSIEFDELSHDYHRFVYHVQHCNADWTPTEGLFESDYLSGFNDQPIEDYEYSFNTTQLYTHYRLQLPNADTRLLLSGNYRVEIFDDGDLDTPLLCAEFSIVEPLMSISPQVSGNTDIDFNQSHQQVSYAVAYGPCRVVDPMREVHTVVLQNRRRDNSVIDLRPNIQKANGIEFTHQRSLIFPAGNEYHKFEILDVQKPGMNVDNMRWYEPFYHATLYADQPARNYVYDEDQNGACVYRNDNDDEDGNITSEYLWVHFALQCPRPLSGSDIYVHGNWTGHFPDPNCRMTWNESAHQYEVALYLKQGYYNYCYLQEGAPTPDGNFHETENEYQILVYHRPQGGRYDKLVGYSCFSSR